MTQTPEAPGTGGAPALEAQRASLGRLRLGVLALLAGCAVVGFVHGDAGASAADPQLSTALTVLAVLVGLGSVFARHFASLPSVPAPSRARWSLLTYLCAGALGPVGLAVTFLLGEGTRGLLYAAVGALFAIRTPPHFTAGAPTRR